MIAIAPSPAHDEPEHDATAVAEQLEAALNALDDPNDECGEKPTLPDGTIDRKSCPLVAPKRPDDVVLRVQGKRFPLPLQDNGWEIPAALRRLSLAALWSIISSASTNHLVKIRAIEALVRLDGQALASERQEDWRSVQSSNSNRSNVRILAELHRSKSNPSKAKSLPKPPKVKR